VKIKQTPLSTINFDFSANMYSETCLKWILNKPKFNHLRFYQASKLWPCTCTRDIWYMYVHVPWNLWNCWNVKKKNALVQSKWNQIKLCSEKF
jgi:hypothetical protein